MTHLDQQALLRRCGTRLLHGLVLLAVVARGQVAQLRGATANTRNTGSKFFLWLSDVHADPFYGTSDQQCSKNASTTARNEFGMFGCDAPYALLRAAVGAAADLQVDFVVFTGDFTRHDQDLLINPAKNVSEIIGNVSEIISEGFPAMVSSDGFVMGALGNDDSPSDYELNITTDSATNSWLARVGGVLANEMVMPDEVYSEYNYGGFFNVTIGGIEILSLDTVIYSMWHTPTTSNLPEDPFNQLRWLRQRLEAATAEGRSVWIVGHIPPGIETYGYTELWHMQYVRAYLSIVEDVSLGNCVAAQLFGHVHKEELRVLPKAPAGAGPVVIMASHSPVYYNNPSFRVVEYDAATGRMLDWRTYYAEIPKGEAEPVWNLGYTASEVYKLLQVAKESGGLTNKAVEELAARMVHEEDEFTSYATWYTTNYSSDLTHCAAKSLAPFEPDLEKVSKTRCVMTYLCAVSITSHDEYKNCTANFRVHNVSELNRSDFASALPEFYEAARIKHWREIGVNVSWHGGGFA